MKTETATSPPRECETAGNDCSEDSLDDVASIFLTSVLYRLQNGIPVG